MSVRCCGATCLLLGQLVDCCLELIKIQLSFPWGLLLSLLSLPINAELISCRLLSFITFAWNRSVGHELMEKCMALIGAQSLVYTNYPTKKKTQVLKFVNWCNLSMLQVWSFYFFQDYWKQLRSFLTCYWKLRNITLSRCCYYLIYLEEGSDKDKKKKQCGSALFYSISFAACHAKPENNS